MTPKEKAKDLVNQKYYQPLTLHLNVNNNSKQMWAYAQRCAHIAVDEVIAVIYPAHDAFEAIRVDYWQEVKKQIDLC